MATTQYNFKKLNYPDRKDVTKVSEKCGNGLTNPVASDVPENLKFSRIPKTKSEYTDSEEPELNDTKLHTNLLTKNCKLPGIRMMP